MATATAHTPETFEQAGAALRAASAAGQRLRIVGGATKTRWGRPPAPLHGELHTSALNQIVAHNAGDMTATLEAGRGREVRFTFRGSPGDTATFRFKASSGTNVTLAPPPSITSAQ